MADIDFTLFDLNALERFDDLLRDWRDEPPELPREAILDDLQHLIDACLAEINRQLVTDATACDILDVVTSRLRSIGQAAPHITVPDDVYLWLTPDQLTDGTWRLAIKLADRINWMRVAAVGYPERVAAGAAELTKIERSWQRFTRYQLCMKRYPVIDQVFVLFHPKEVHDALRYRIRQEFSIHELTNDQQVVWLGQHGFATPFRWQEFGEDVADLLYAAWWQEIRSSGPRHTAIRLQVAPALVRTWEPGVPGLRWFAQSEPGGPEPEGVDGVLFRGGNAAVRPIPADLLHSPATGRWWVIMRVHRISLGDDSGWLCDLQPTRAPR